MFRGGEDRCAAFILYRQQLLLGVDINIQGTVINGCSTTLIEPIRKTTIIEFILVILYADSVMSHRDNLQKSVTKVQGRFFLLCIADEGSAEKENSKNNISHFCLRLIYFVLSLFCAKVNKILQITL